MCWMLLPNLLLATGRPRSSNIFGRWVCQHLFGLNCPPSSRSWLAGSMRSGRGCMPSQGLLLSRAPSYARIMMVHTHRACCRALLSLALGWQEHAPFVLLPAWGRHLPIEMGRFLSMAFVAHDCPRMHLGQERQLCFRVSCC